MNIGYIGLNPESYFGFFPVSSLLFPYFATWDLHLFHNISWWIHIMLVLIFLNELPYSKHFHVVMSIPNVYFSNIENLGKMENLPSVTKEVKLMMDPNVDPYATPPADSLPPAVFGAKDVTDLNWVQLMNAYSCTECGRCTSECPANQTGKLLSPRKIMMDTRQRLKEVGKNIDKHGKDYSDNKSLLNDYISTEELWACTTCNACTQACPLNIDPLSIIVDLRRYLVMEESAAPQELNMMFNNVENNGAPWQFSAADRLKWKDE
jgi:heterodisulfide reductase subunit C